MTSPPLPNPGGKIQSAVRVPAVLWMVLKTADSPGIGEKRGMHGDGGHQPVLMGFLLATAHRVPGEIKRSRDLGRGRWSWTLSLAQKRS